MNAIRFSHAEVTSIGRHGLWLQVGEEELYLPFCEFPRFEHATIAQICQVQCVSAQHLAWPAIGLDLSLDTLRNPLGPAARNNLGEH